MVRVDKDEDEEKGKAKKKARARERGQEEKTRARTRSRRSERRCNLGASATIGVRRGRVFLAAAGGKRRDGAGGEDAGQPVPAPSLGVAGPRSGANDPRGRSGSGSAGGHVRRVRRVRSVRRSRRLGPRHAAVLERRSGVYCSRSTFTSGSPSRSRVMVSCQGWQHTSQSCTMLPQTSGSTAISTRSPQ